MINGIGVPLALSLQPRAHLDSPDLDDQMAGELGSLLVRIERAMLASGDLGRVHFSKWCDVAPISTGGSSGAHSAHSSSAGAT